MATLTTPFIALRQRVSSAPSPLKSPNWAFQSLDLLNRLSIPPSVIAISARPSALRQKISAAPSPLKSLLTASVVTPEEEPLELEELELEELLLEALEELLELELEEELLSIMSSHVFRCVHSLALIVGFCAVHHLAV